MKNTQNTQHQENFPIIPTETEISPMEFAGFLSFLKNIQPHFNDFCMIEDTFRSRTNDYSCIVETGFPYFCRMNFNFGSIKKVANMLSALDKKSRIAVKVDHDSVTFADKSQDIQLPIITTSILHQIDLEK